MPKMGEFRGDTKLREMAQRIDRRSVDPPMLSKFEKGHCVPPVHLMPDICRAYGRDVWELFTPDELDYGAEREKRRRSAESARKEASRTRTHKRTFRVTNSVASWLTPDIFAACGYTSAQSWFDKCIRQLHGEYAAKRRAAIRKGG